MPRMTNTYMLGGDKDPGEILASVKNGIYAVNFGGGQVDITNGKFVFSLHRGLPIENGKLGCADQGRDVDRPGPESLTRVSMIGNDMKLERAWAPAARTARACRSAWGNRHCGWMA